VFERRMVSIAARALLFVWALMAPAAVAAQPRPARLEVLVTDRAGNPLAEAHVTAQGPSSRDGETAAGGRLTLRNLKPGSYRLRVEHTGFAALERELTVRAGATASAEAALSPGAGGAPGAGPAGAPRALSIPDLVQKEFIGREPVKTTFIGCSGPAAARMIQVHDPLARQRHADADEMLYVLAGDATLQLGTRKEAVSSGWFSVVPRGTEYTLTRKGRNPVVLLSILAGPPCAPPAAGR
jgi:mannose-6-phosphate isomerase-like protein (cupin superfamily)